MPRISAPRAIVPAYPVVRWLLQTVLAYSLLFTVSLWLPIGAHRVVMGRRDAWHWAASYAALAAGALVWFAAGRHEVGVMALVAGAAGRFFHVFGDLFTMWSWKWPFERTIADQFQSLNKRFNLLENAGLFLIVALGMLFFARVA